MRVYAQAEKRASIFLIACGWLVAPVIMITILIVVGNGPVGRIQRFLIVGIMSIRVIRRG